MISDNNFSNNDEKMKISCLEVIQYFQNNGYFPIELKRAKRAFEAKIGKHYSMKCSLKYSLLYPDVFCRLLYKKIKKEL